MIFQKRECVKCSNTVPTCPKCADGEQCQMMLQTCDTCATYICSKISGSSSQSNSSSGSSGTNSGAIAGGVVGGLVLLAALLLFGWWRWYYKPRAQKRASEKTAGDEYTEDEKNHSENRSSALESVNSLSPSEFGRSSNVIPIAYIPGVTTRAINNGVSAQPYGNDSDPNIQSRASIAANNYRGSTAVISSAMMTAIQARPNLVDISSKSRSYEIREHDDEAEFNKDNEAISERESVVSYQSAMSGTKHRANFITTATPTIVNTITSTKKPRSNPEPIKEESYLGGTLADLDGRASPFDDHYKV